MREDVLQFIWGKNKVPLQGLYTTNNHPISIVTPGILNKMAGPDFSNARMYINGQEWFGSVEVHSKSSNWHRHKHGTDPNYTNVILHVVWDDDTPIANHNGAMIPTLQLKDHIPVSDLEKYNRFLRKENVRFITCERDLHAISQVIKRKWLCTLFIERLKEKSTFINELLQITRNDWEQVFFMVLLKSTGLNHNGKAFLSLAKEIDFSIIRKIGKNSFQLESLLFGLSGLLGGKSPKDGYQRQLQKEYRFLRTKFKLNEDAVQKPEFFRLRPHNFPTIRLSQVAALYGRNINLFNELISQKTLKGLYGVLQTSSSEYWDTHFNFGKTSSFLPKKMSRTFIDLLILNAVLPVLYEYNAFKGIDVSETIRGIGAKMLSERNKIVRNFKKLGMVSNSANDSQALLQLYQNYCTRNNCLQCSLGSHLLGGK